jgi:hypothetical protein
MSQTLKKVSNETMNASEIVAYYLMYVVTGIVLYMMGNNLDLTLIDTYKLLSVVGICIVGGYQLYFWIQRYTQTYKNAIILGSFIDDYIPFVPETVIVYSPLYYLTFALVITTVKDYTQLVDNIFAAMVLLTLQVICFFMIPTTVPNSYRKFNIKRINIFSRSTIRLLEYVQSFDDMHNACPSAHCSFAVLLSFMLIDKFYYYSYLFPVLIASSCLLTKQHVIIDTFFGIALGFFVGWYFV